MRRLPRFATWQLVAMLVPLAIIAATFLRFNNLGMIERRDAVIVADRTGDEVAIKESLAELQSHVSSHMNTSLGNGIVLTETYARASQAAVDAAANTTNPQSSIYQQAAVECRGRFQGGTDSFRNDYVACVIERVSQLQPANDPLSGVNVPEVEDYRYNFASPLWSPDAAGITILVIALIVGVILWRIVSRFVLSLMLRHHYREQI
jgi:hypothetical protein